MLKLLMTITKLSFIITDNYKDCIKFLEYLRKQDFPMEVTIVARQNANDKFIYVTKWF